MSFPIPVQSAPSTEKTRSDQAEKAIDKVLREYDPFKDDYQGLGLVRIAWILKTGPFFSKKFKNLGFEAVESRNPNLMRQLTVSNHVHHGISWAFGL